MPLPAGYLPRKGDVLIFHGAATRDVRESDDSVRFKIDGALSDPIIKLASIVGIYSRCWYIDDPVRTVAQPITSGKVIGVDEDQVWVKTERGMFITVRANDLEADVPAPAAAEPPLRSIPRRPPAPPESPEEASTDF